MSDSKISIRNLYKIFGSHGEKYVNAVKGGISKQELLDKHRHVLGLQDINLEIPPRRLQVVMGLSGSGKSTLIRHINRLIEPTAGEMIVDGVDVLTMSKQELQHFRTFGASMVFQKFALLPHYTVFENACYGLKIQKKDKTETQKYAMHWLERVGLSGFEDRYPAQLSGGMQQRVGLARALATDADILLMDEAFSALDPLIRADMQTILLDLQKELHKTIVFITHDLDEALRIGDDIAILRDGRMVQQGSPENIVLNPADDYVADFTKDVNRARVLTLGTLPTKSTQNDAVDLDSSLTLELALQETATAHKDTVNVLNDGKNLGQVTLSEMIAAISRPQQEGNSQNTVYR